MQKYSSNVIEKCLERADPKTRSLFIEEMGKSDKLISKFFFILTLLTSLGLIRNPYGNFVV